MNLSTLVLSCLVLAALAGLVWSVKLATRKAISREEAEQRMGALNIDALAKLMDREEQLFLRARLPIRTFRQLQRKRMRVALAYLSDLSVVISAFDSASIDHLRTLIMRTRLQALRIWLFPSSPVDSLEIVPELRRFTNSSLNASNAI